MKITPEQIAELRELFAEESADLDGVEYILERAPALVDDLEEARAEIAQLRKAVGGIIEPRRCLDGSCIWGQPAGMHTNSTCKHRQLSKPEMVKELSDIAKALRAALKGGG